MFKSQNNKRLNAFTFVEVVAAVALLAIMFSSVLVLMNRFVGAVIDMRLRQTAFELARSNMESLLSESKLPDIYEYGESETNPNIRWQTVVEPFYTPYKNRMWIRAVCSASFTDSKGEEENVELEHWITNLTAAQIKQILAQQEVEAEYMALLNEGQYSDMQLATIAYLEQEGLDVDAYEEFLEQQQRKKLEYLDKKGMDGYEDYVEQLQKEEDEFLEDLGMNFDDYNVFAESYVPPASEGEGESDISEPEDSIDQDGDDTTNVQEDNTDDSSGGSSGDPRWDWANIPKELWPLIEQLTGAKAPSQ
ncbi:MAG: hypothetical protein ISS71_04995 [Phycisphaerae bacterium]|nr:hypothetical protein [Phycisphaerae bacterium]